jgi:hypothetical protein
MISGGLVPQVQNDPIYSLPHLYISGLNVSIASNTVIALAPGAARDMNNNIDMEVGFPNLQGVTVPSVLYQNYSPPLFINSGVVGANGLDAGVLAASSNYGVWLIGDSRGYKPVAGLLSLTSNAYPLLPFGYDSLRLIGFAASNSSTHFASVLNASALKAFYLQPAVSVLSGGDATTFTAIDLSSAIPTTTDVDVIAFLLVTFIPAAVGDYYQFRPTGSSATTGLITVVGIAAGIAQTQYLQVICGVGASKPEIDYLVSSASDSLSVSVVGYSYTIT